MSFYICRTLEPKDLNKTPRFAEGSAADVKWFQLEGQRYLNPNRSDVVIMTVVEETATQEIDACLVWEAIDLGKRDVPNVLLSMFGYGPVWGVARWAFQGLHSGPRDSRTFGEGRAVELVDHTFNEANQIMPSVGVVWSNVRPDLETLLDRSGFKRASGNTWARPTMREPKEELGFSTSGRQSV